MGGSQSGLSWRRSCTLLFCNCFRPKGSKATPKSLQQREERQLTFLLSKPDNACCAQVVENLSLRHERHKKRTSKYILRTLRRHEPMTLHATFSAYTATLLIWTKGAASYISAPFCRLVSQPTGYHIGISGRIRKLTINGRRLLSAIAHIPVPSLVRMGRFSV